MTEQPQGQELAVKEDNENNDEVHELKGLDRVSMKKKLMKLDQIIQNKGELRTKLQPNGLPMIEYHREDAEFGKEHEYILKTLKKGQN